MPLDLIGHNYTPDPIWVDTYIEVNGMYVVCQVN